MRLLPRSLFGRLVLILLGGLILAQFATAYINYAERGQLLFRAGGMRLAQQISDIVKLLDSLPPAERHRVVAIFNAPPLAVSLDRAPLAAASPAASVDFHQSMFAAVLRYALGDERELRLVRVEGIPPSLRAPPREALPGMPMMQRRGWGPGMQGPAAEGRYYTVQVPLRDGTWVSFDSMLAPQASALPWRLATTLGILLVSVIVLSLVAVHWATAPLSALALAAEKLGEDINRPPLPETGPLEAQRAAKAFNTMQQRLSRFIDERSRMLAAMSHDLKTPITRLRLRAELLDDEPLRAKFEKDLQEMEAMVTQTLDFMRDTSSREAVQQVDVMALLESLQTDYRETGASVEIEGRAAQPYPARPSGLRRCIGNLLDNAIRYGGRATIVVEDGADRLILRVRDAGPGMPQQDLERAFEPFYRGESSRNRETGGTGLGLGIARNIARAHGGDLTLENRPEVGLEAALMLPRSAG